MADAIDAEIDAIKSVLKALEPLPVATRASVLAYVSSRLDIFLPARERGASAAEGAAVSASVSPAQTTSAPVTHIKALKDLKKPKSANEMAALVAYYLAEVASQKDRKDRITSKDIETYFKIAEFPLTKIQFTLANAKAAGYLDAVGNGEYRLNAVGHNLVVHSLPRDGGKPSPGRKLRAAKKASPSKRAKKASKSKKR